PSLYRMFAKPGEISLGIRYQQIVQATRARSPNQADHRFVLDEIPVQYGNYQSERDLIHPPNRRSRYLHAMIALLQVSLESFLVRGHPNDRLLLSVTIHRAPIGHQLAYHQD